MFTRKRTWITVAAAAALVVGLAGCAGGSASDSSGEATEDLVWGAILAPSTFDVSQAEWANASPYMQAVYDTLLRATPEGSVEANLATDWEYNDDKTVLTLTLRDDVTFTDGTAFDADVAAQNLLRFRDGGSATASNLALVTDVTATDATHVQMTLSAPNPGLLFYLTQNTGLMGSPAAFDSPDAATVPVGSGPYILDSDATVIGSSYVYTANPDYWNPDAQHYDKLTINAYTDPSAILNAVKAGEVDVALAMDNSALPQMEASGYSVAAVENTWLGLLLLDRNGTMTPALGDVRVRQAINHAFDRDAMVTAIAGGYGTATEQIFGPPTPSFASELDDTYEYDPDEAKKLIAEAGYPDGFAIAMPTAPAVPEATYTLIAQQLADIGITVDYTSLDTSNYINAIIAADYSAGLMPLPATMDSWTMAQFQFSPTALFNSFKVSDPKLDTILAAIQTGTDEEAEQASIEANEFLVDNAWFAPLYRPQVSFVSNEETSVTAQADNAVPYL